MYKKDTNKKQNNQCVNKVKVEQRLQPLIQHLHAIQIVLRYEFATHQNFEIDNQFRFDQYIEREVTLARALDCTYVHIIKRRCTYLHTSYHVLMKSFT